MDKENLPNKFPPRCVLVNGPNGTNCYHPMPVIYTTSAVRPIAPPPTAPIYAAPFIDSQNYHPHLIQVPQHIDPRYPGFKDIQQCPDPRILNINPDVLRPVQNLPSHPNQILHPGAPIQVQPTNSHIRRRSDSSVECRLAQSSLSPTEKSCETSVNSSGESNGNSSLCLKNGSGVTKRSSKQQVEKQRRERINSSVNELKSLLLQENSCSSAKLEKADVLELAVSRIRELEQKSRPKTLGEEIKKEPDQGEKSEDLKNSVTRYAAGFAQCTKEVLSFFDLCDELKMDSAVKMKLFNHLQSCTRTLESATQKPVLTSYEPSFEGTSPGRYFHQTDVKRSPFSSVNMYNQGSPRIQSQLKTPPRIAMSPATPISVKNTHPTTPQQFLRPHMIRQPHFSKQEPIFGSSPVLNKPSPACFRDSIPVLLGTVATPPTPKQSITTSSGRSGTGTLSSYSRQNNYSVCCTPSPPRKLTKTKKSKNPIARSNLIDSPGFDDESNDEEIAGFEPMFPTTQAFDSPSASNGNIDPSCWRPW